MKYKKQIKCIMCNSKQIELFDAKPSPFVLFKMFNNKELGETYLCHCKHCDFYWSNYRPSDEEAENYYCDYISENFVKLRKSFEPDYLKEAQKNSKNLYARKKYKSRQQYMEEMFNKHFDYRQIYSVLDYGGGYENFITDNFCNASKFVYDLSENVKRIKDITIINRHVLNSQKYDFIQCCHTLEHVSQPKKIILELLSLLSYNGYLYIELPYEDWFLQNIKNKSSISIHEHINFFRLSVLQNFFDKKNFCILECKIIDIDGLLGGQNRVIAFLVKKTKPSVFNMLKNKYFIFSGIINRIKQVIKKKYSVFREYVVLFYIKF